MTVRVQKATLPPAGHMRWFSGCLVSRLSYSTCVLAAASVVLAGAQSLRVGQAVNGDHARGAGHRQETQSGHERNLWGFNQFVTSKRNLGAVLTSNLCVRVGGLPGPCRTPLQVPDEAFVLCQPVGQPGLGGGTTEEASTMNLE